MRLLLLCIISILVGCSPNPNEILERSIDKCQSIENGYYEMTKYLKLMSSVDTFKITQSSYFKKLASDSVFTFAFHSNLYSDSIGSIRLLYTGDDMIAYTDSVGTIISKRDRLNDIKLLYVKNPGFSSFGPVTSRDCFPLPSSDMLKIEDATIKFMGKEFINGVLCYHIHVKMPPSCDKSSLSDYVSRLDYDFWITKEDYIPIQYSISKDIKANNSIQNQYEKYLLTKYDFNNLEDQQIITTKSLPSHIKLNQLAPFLSEEPLQTGQKAANWELQSISKEKLSLFDLKDSLILLDFFYISCPPCIENIPNLIFLHEKYQKRGLKVVGISSVLNKENDIDYFIKKHKIDYPILIGTPEVIKQYNVSAYPTIYLINKDGEIISQHIGSFLEGDLNKLENLILENL